jgi:hypothetical protein
MNFIQTNQCINTHTWGHSQIHMTNIKLNLNSFKPFWKNGFKVKGCYRAISKACGIVGKKIELDAGSEIVKIKKVFLCICRIYKKAEPYGIKANPFERRRRKATDLSFPLLPEG